MVKLTGWKRIGIIASVVWILGAGLYTYVTEMDKLSQFSGFSLNQCDELVRSDIDRCGKDGQIDKQCEELAWKRWRKCNDEALDYIPKVAAPNARLVGAIVAFVPVPLGWGFAYLVLFLVRWVKRGFMRPF